MYGTEKQVLYAQDIIINAQKHVDGIIDNYEKSNETEEGKWAEMNRDVIAAAKDVKNILDKYVLEFDDACQWIKNKNQFSVQNLNNEINKRIKRYCKKRKGMEMIELGINYRP